jgi:rubrerythrin
MEVPMTIEEAIKTAIEYETKIRDLYKAAAESTQDPAATRIFNALGDDEQGHLAYLEDRLRQWRKTGRITAERLETTIPSREVISREVEKLKPRLAEDDQKSEKQMFSKALHLEVETSRFYEQMVAEMTDEGQKMFARFVEIENGHIDMVQAELDYISGTGYWFDVKEFDMSGY